MIEVHVEHIVMIIIEIEITVFGMIIHIILIDINKDLMINIIIIIIVVVEVKDVVEIAKMKKYMIRGGRVIINVS